MGLAIRSYLFAYWPLLEEGVKRGGLQFTIVLALLAPFAIVLSVASINAARALAGLGYRWRWATAHDALLKTINDDLGSEQLTSTEMANLRRILVPIRLAQIDAHAEAGDLLLLLHADGCVTRKIVSEQTVAQQQGEGARIFIIPGEVCELLGFEPEQFEPAV